MSINLTDELLAKTKKGKIASAKQVFLEGDQENLQQIGEKTHQLEDAIKDITVSGGASTANAVSYNNETSGMTAVTAQGAIDELAAKNKEQDAAIGTKAEKSEVATEVDKKFDKENIAQEFGDSEDKVVSQFALPFRYIQNEEFIFAKVDANDKLLFGIEWDGTPKFGKTSAVEDRLQAQVNLLADKVTAILGDDDTTSAIDTLKELKNFFATIDNTQTLTSILANLNDTIDKVAIKDEAGEIQDTPFRVISNDEFLLAVVDSEDKLLFSIYRDTGKPYYPFNEMYHVVQNEEFFALWLDVENHILLGIRRDGQIIGEIHAVNALKEVISSLQEKVDTIDASLQELLDVFSLLENPEYLAVEKDADGRVLSATYNDGSHYSHNLKSETLDAKVDKKEGKSLIDSDVADAHSTFEDIEKRMEIVTDADGKIMAYRDTDGKKHEHDMEVTNLDVSNLNLQGNSVNNIQDALKANGFDVKIPIDWSAYLSNDGKSPLCIPEPRCARINISGIDSMPTTKTTNAKAYFEMWDMQGNYFKKKVIMNAQGNSTMKYPKKSFACDFFDEDWNGASFAVKFGDWVPQDSFHFKAQYSDFFKGISIVAYKLVQEVWASRSPIYSNPWKKALLSSTNISSGSYDNESINDLSLQKDTGAKCIPDAFPCVVYLNGDFYGIFNWALKKHRDNYHLNKSSETNIHIDGGYQSFLTPMNWKLVEIRNPKGLLTNVPTDDGFEAYDGDSPKELLGTDTEGYDSNNKKHKLSAQVKKSILEFNSLARELNAMTNENGGEVFLNKHYDIENLIDFYVLQYVLADEDIAYNWQWITYDGIKWFVCDYDKDRTFGQFFNCPGTRQANQMLNAVDVSSNNYPFKYIYTYHKSEIKQRYNELKELGLFTPKHLIDLVKNWFDRYSVEDIKLEYKKWNESPSNRDNNVNNEYWKIKSPYYSTQDENTYDNEKTYNVGETCAYGKGRYTVFECIKESVGNPPITKFYDNIPYDLGYRDSIWRLIKYIQDRFIYIESEISKL